MTIRTPPIIVFEFKQMNSNKIKFKQVRSEIKTSLCSRLLFPD